MAASAHDHKLCSFCLQPQTFFKKVSDVGVATLTAFFPTGKSNFVEHLGWRPLNAFGSTMGSVAESYKKQSLAQKQGSVEYMIVFIKLSLRKVFEDP